MSRTLKYDFYGSFLDSFNLQREFVGNVVTVDLGFFLDFCMFLCVPVSFAFLVLGF